MLVTDYIEGKVFQKFKHMSQSEKDACRECIVKLHESNILHGDIRAPNFIVQQSNRKVFVIDFGRAKIINEDTEGKIAAEMDSFDRQLNADNDSDNDNE